MNEAMETAAIETDPYASAAEAFIEACGGDPRDAVLALLGHTEYLEGRVQMLEASMSWGYVRLRPVTPDQSLTHPETSPR